jgi:uncharacterized protein (DUF58 family)
MDGFPIAGAAVALDDLLKLQSLALDLKKIKALPTRSKRLGEQRSKYRGQGREFIEMKHYQSGDDVRQIDWRQTAKKQTPFVRVMEEDRHSEHVIWLSLNARSYFGTRTCFKSVMACHWAAFLIWRFIQLKHPIRLIIQVGTDWQEEIRITSTRYGAQACQLICDAHQYLAENFHQLHDVKPEQTPHWNGHPNLWIISDFLGDELQRFQKAVTAKPATALTCLQTLDLFDLKLPDAPALPVKHNQRSGWIRTQDKTTQRKHIRSFTERQSQVNKLCWQFQGQLFDHVNNEFDWREVHSWPLHH